MIHTDFWKFHLGTLLRSQHRETSRQWVWKNTFSNWTSLMVTTTKFLQKPEKFTPNLAISSPLMNGTLPVSTHRENALNNGFQKNYFSEKLNERIHFCQQSTWKTRSLTGSKGKVTQNCHTPLVAPLVESTDLGKQSHPELPTLQIFPQKNGLQKMILISPDFYMEFQNFRIFYEF